VLNLPNALTLLRFVLAPLIAWLLLQRRDELAVALFAISALSDFVDGWIARRWNQRTRFGAVADPLADKLTGLLVVAVLTLQGTLPWWFAAAVVARDVAIVGGALAFHLRFGHVEMAPSRISKANTAALFVLLVGVLAVRAGLLPDGAWLQALLFATLATTAASGVQYVLEWAGRARQAGARRRAGRPAGGPPSAPPRLDAR